MKYNKSPGTDGFTSVLLLFLRVFETTWNYYYFILFIFCLFFFFCVVRCVNDGFEKSELSATQKEGLIVCIAKVDKSKEYIKNWRPISLLNIVYKISSSCIANRLKKVLPSLINENQTEFMSNRYMGDSIRLI